MDFDKAVQLFQRKKRNGAPDKRAQYAELIKEYTEMKYRRSSSGERVERELTPEQLAPKASKEDIRQKAVADSEKLATDLASFIDINIPEKK